MHDRVTIVLTRFPLRYLSYCHYLILGFHELSKKGEIVFKIRPSKISDRFSIRFYRLVTWLKARLRAFKSYPARDYCLEGYLEYAGQKVRFCYDIADAPYYFNTSLLKKVDLYFKAQCPIEIKDDGFHLTDDIIIPYQNGVAMHKDKILASMLGPGFNVSNIRNYRRLKREFEKLVNDDIIKSQVLMCYFGNAKGPVPISSDTPDIYNNEANLLAFFGDRISHPNEKRAIAAQLISTMGDGYDARVINDNASGSNTSGLKNGLFIPLSDYSKHIAKFKYNLNISGHRLSIPYRFIFSFAVGTAIITDKLHVKWYLPFKDEVIETTEMGYLKVKDVNWNAFKETINTLPELSVESVKGEFISKWTPEAFARYIVKSCNEIRIN